MIKRILVIILILLALTIISCARSVYPTGRIHKIGALDVGESQPLALVVTTNKSEYKLGELVWIDMSLCNTSDKEVTFLNGWYEYSQESSLKLFDSSNNEVTRGTWFEMAPPQKTSFISLAPETCYSSKFAINANGYKLFRIELPGEYRLVSKYINNASEYYYIYDVAGPSNAWIGTIEADTVRFTVVP
jgi:hypothetical protein